MMLSEKKINICMNCMVTRGIENTYVLHSLEGVNDKKHNNTSEGGSQDCKKYLFTKSSLFYLAFSKGKNKLRGSIH